MPAATLSSNQAPTAKVEPSAESATLEPNWSPAPVLDALTYAGRLTVQSLLQPSLSTLLLPSSHISPAVTTPLPQAVTVQLLSQPSPFAPLPSSHTSVRRLTWPSPHVLSLQACRQSSSLFRLPSSHSSSVSTTLLPHVFLRQVGMRSTDTQRYPSEHHPSPHASPGGGRHASAPTTTVIRRLNITARLIRFLIRRSSCSCSVLAARPRPPAAACVCVQRSES